jgi:hypothetical protein
MTSYNYSYNVLINRLEAFAAGHFLIKRFTHGQIDLADQLQDDQYPFMHVTPDTITPIQGGMQFGFMIMFADIPRDKEYKAEYQREVISDCVRLGQDLIAEVRNGLELFGFDVQLVNNPTFEPFIEEYKNTVTGVAFTIQLEVPWDWSACDIPAVWTVGGSSSGGSGTGYGLTLRTNGVDNAVQNILDLVEGTNVTITDNGDGSVTIDAAGGGGGGGEYVSTEWNANHTTAQGNPYQIGDRVWYNGSVYRCIANNDGINPTNPTYWTLQAVGYRLRQTPVDWNASSGDYQILNKPNIPDSLDDLLPGTTKGQLIQHDGTNWEVISGLAIDELLDVQITTPANGDALIYDSGTSKFENTPLAAVATSGDYNDLSNLPTIPAAQIQSDWTQANTAALDYIKNKPTLPATVGDMTKAVYDQLDVGIVESAHKEMVAVINKTGANVPEGSIVYLKTSSASGTYPEIVLATATTEVGSSKTIGAVYEDIANDATGYVVTSGEVRNLDTSAYSIGDRLWLGTTAGSVTTTPPAEPNHTVFIGTVTRAQNGNGRILYAIQNGYELNELHGVQVTSEANRQGLFYNSTSGLWENRLIEVADLPTGIDAANIGTGSVSNTEFGYLDGVTSAIQTQINNKKDSLAYGNVYAVTVGASSTVYAAISGLTTFNATETNRHFAVPVAGTIKNFYVKMSGTQSATGTLVITIRNNATSSSVTVTVSSADGASPTKSDNVNSLSISAGDLLSIQLINNATVTSASVVSMSFIIERT